MLILIRIPFSFHDTLLRVILRAKRGIFFLMHDF